MAIQVKCTNCHYAELVYDKHGLVTGITCHNNDIKFIEWATANVMCCGAWSEVDE